MKRLFMMVAVSALLMASGAMAVTMCLYNGGGCWPDGGDGCEWGWQFDGGLQGEDTYCSGGTYIGPGPNREGTTPPSGGQTAQGCCRWASSGECETVFSAQEVTDCSGANKYLAGDACPAKTLANPSGCPAGLDGPTGPLMMCLYESGDCWPDDGDCASSGWQFEGGKEGKGTLCAGGTFTGIGKSDTPPTSVGVLLGCCLWAETGKSNEVYSAAEMADCDDGVNTWYPGYVANSTMTGCVPNTSVSYRPTASASATSMRATYNRGTITVNWNAGTRITDGKVSIVNIRGVTVASSTIRSHSGNINAKLNSKSIPAGYYLVRIDARNASGKQIVQQVPLSIVK